MAPFGWYRFYPLPESIGIQGVQSILKIQQCLGRHLTVNPPIKIAGSAKVSLQVRHGTTEEVSVIDRIGIQPTISVGARPDSDNMWRFAVTDNGIGFSKKDYQRVFEPFMRLHNDTVQGTGLGLATCKKIVERHGGTIRCESTVGEGTTFFFTLRGARG